MNAQIAIDAVAQMETIHKRASLGLQAYASGEDSEELITTLIAIVGRIFVETNDPDLSEVEKIQAFTELMKDVTEDRKRNKKVWFEVRLDGPTPSYYEYPNLKPGMVYKSDEERRYWQGGENDAF